MTITGQTNKANELIRLYVYEDLLNETGKQISECQSDAKGNSVGGSADVKHTGSNVHYGVGIKMAFI